MIKLSKYKELSDTIHDMTSPYYEDRFRAEYNQLLIRLAKLEDMILKQKIKSDPVENENLYFLKYNPLLLLEKQAAIMRELLNILMIRAKIEYIDLTGDRNYEKTEKEHKNV